MTEAAEHPARRHLEAGRYLIDPVRSQVSITGRHLVGLARVRGSFSVSGGTINVSEPKESSHATVEIDTASFRSGNARRDRNVQGRRFLDAVNRPVITAQVTSVSRDGDVLTGQGVLTAGAQPAPFTVVVTGITLIGAELQGVGRARIDRYAHGLTAMKGIVGRYLELEVKLVATQV